MLGDDFMLELYFMFIGRGFLFDPSFSKRHLPDTAGVSYETGNAYPSPSFT
jgi:hypothetical protein